MNMLYGTVDVQGYSIKHNGVVIYRAGNCNLESTTVVPPSDPTALSIKTLTEYCKNTGKEYAEELGIEWLGVIIIHGVSDD